MIDESHRVQYCASYVWFMENKNKTMDENYFYPSKEHYQNHREKMMWIYVLWAIFSLKILVNIVSQCPNLQNLSCVRPRINFNKSILIYFYSYD